MVECARLTATTWWLTVFIANVISAGRSFAADPIDIGDRKQLLIDDRFIARSENIKRVANPAQKMGRIKDEKGVPYFNHIDNVLDHEGKIRLYIGADHAEVIESDDGLTFRRTDINLPGQFPTIFIDPHESDPARKYKLFWGKYSDPFNPQIDGIYGAFSADGVHFNEPRVVLPFWTDNPTIVMRDANLDKYVIYLRAHAVGHPNQRRVARIVTDDPLKPWPFKGKRPDNNLFCIENADVVVQADDADPPMSDIYYNAATQYPWAEDVRLMFLSNFRHFGRKEHPFIRPNAKGQWEDFGMLEIQLAVSRDGIRWDRLSREPYFPTGLADEWDRWYATMGPGMVRRGNYIYQYYTSTGRGHDGVILRPEYDHAAKELGGIGLLRQRLDGLVSVDADHKGGSFETPPIKFSGKRLRLNIDTGSMGTAFVEFRDEQRTPIPGFTLADCEEIGGNFIDQAVYFKGNPDVSALSGKQVKIHFKLKRAKLFAFQFTAE